MKHINIIVTKQKYSNLLSKMFGDDFTYNGKHYRINSWGVDNVEAIELDRIGGVSVKDEKYLFIVQ